MRVMMSRLYSGVLVGVLYTECAHRPRTSWHTNARYKHAQTTTVVGFECVVRVQFVRTHNRGRMAQGVATYTERLSAESTCRTARRQDADYNLPSSPRARPLHLPITISPTPQRARRSSHTRRATAEARVLCLPVAARLPPLAAAHVDLHQLARRGHCGLTSHAARARGDGGGRGVAHGGVLSRWVRCARLCNCGRGLRHWREF